jgi:hypothetical protein
MALGIIVVKLKLSLWSAIKLRIAGFRKERRKVTIEELIERDR